MTGPVDPTALFHQMLSQWEQMANAFGGDALKSDAFAKGLHGAGAAAMQAQEAARAASSRALAAANLPSREEVIDLSARLARVEASLERIEAAITGLAGGGLAGGRPARDDRPRPKRTRKPPATGG